MDIVVINEPDLKILRELQRDSDQSLDQISEQVGLSRNAVCVMHHIWEQMQIYQINSDMRFLQCSFSWGLFRLR